MGLLEKGLIREGGLLERGAYWKLETLDGGLIREGGLLET